MQQGNEMNPSRYPAMLMVAAATLFWWITDGEALAEKTDSFWQRAYQRETAVLEAEKKELELLLDSHEQQVGQTKDKLKREIEQLSTRLTELTLENDQLDHTLQRAAGNGVINADRQEMIKRTLERANDFLAKYDLQITRTGGEQKQLREIYGAVAELLPRISQLRIEEGDYFNADGKQQNGELLRLSQVAAIALAKEDGGILGPVGDAGLAVVQPLSTETIRASLNDGNAVRTRLFLFDPAHPDYTTVYAPQKMWKTFLSGGFFMWPIVFLAVIALLIALQRIWVIVGCRGNTHQLKTTLRPLIEEGRFDRAALLCKDQKQSIPQITHVIMQHSQLSRSDIEEMVCETIARHRSKLAAGLPILAVIAVLTPLLGLLGTVTGMIKTFELITEFGTGDTKLMSAGIAEALLTTQLGLSVAVPVLLAHTLLRGRVNYLVEQMEIYATQLLNYLQQTKVVQAVQVLPKADESSGPVG